MGQALYPSATRLLITADAGGSNGYRLRLWKLELQKLARALKSTCAIPPGTSKWNKMLVLRTSELARKEPRGGGELDRGDHDPDGARVQSQLDTNRYPAGLSDDELEAIYLRRDSFHGEWN